MHQICFGKTRIAVGHHMHVAEYMDDHLTAEEKEIITTLSPRKKKEWLASRELLFLLSGEAKRLQCAYDDFGKPFLVGSQQHISISHSELWCAAMISDQICGVDIQLYSSTVQRIAERFLSEAEFALARNETNINHALHLLWGAKECLYKAYGKKKLVFKENIRIFEIDLVLGKAKGLIQYEGLHLQYDIYYRMLPEVAWVFCLERSRNLHELSDAM